jgi:CRISPR-associated protein Cmr5
MNRESEIKKLERGRAEFAYRCVEEAVKKLDEKRRKEYRSYTRKISTMILSNGLGQTLAFVKAKAKDGNAYELLYAQMTEYMKSNSVIRIQMPPDKNELIEWVISCDSKEYRWITQELLAFLNWLKRFAEGMIEEEGE